MSRIKQQLEKAVKAMTKENVKIVLDRIWKIC